MFNKLSLPQVLSLILALIFFQSCRLSAEEVKLYKQTEPDLETAIFAGGCFWCMEPPFEKLAGVKAVLSGYTGGKEQAPSYKEVAYGKTTHLEAVLVVFDPKIIQYEELLFVFWRQINPTQSNGQFVDIGPHYRTAIFATSKQQEAAKKSKAELISSGVFKEKIVTPILEAQDFWIAEEYHQDFYKKSPDHYYRYRVGSGRDFFLNKTWGEQK